MVRILILGCGWVGESFAELAMERGAEIVATVTTEEKVERLRKKGMDVLVHHFGQSACLPLAYKHFDYVLNSIPASKKHSEQEVAHRFQQVSALIGQLDYGKHIYLSSIGIYPEAPGTFNESYRVDGSATDEHMEAAHKDLHPTLLLAEREMASLPNTIIYRLGGLFGKERIFAKYFAGKEYPHSDQPANFIHVADVVELLWLGFARALVNRVYNIVCPVHPTKGEVIRASARRYGFPLPINFSDNPERLKSETSKSEPANSESTKPEETGTVSIQKLVSGQLILDELRYTPIYSNPVDF